MITKEYEEFWRSVDPEWWAEIDLLQQERPAPVRIDKPTNQKLTTWTTPLDKRGAGQFLFDLGAHPNKARIKLNFAWGNVGPGNTFALNRWAEELQYLLRNEQGIKIYKATTYLPNTQDFQTWCQFIEVRQYNEPKQAYCIWNGDTIISSRAKPLIRPEATEWSFDWRNAKSLDEMLFLVKDIK